MIMIEIDKAMNIQKKYEEGIINTSAITEDEYNMLEKVYIMQIYKMNKTLQENQKQIKKYKQEIIDIRKKL